MSEGKLHITVHILVKYIRKYDIYKISKDTLHMNDSHIDIYSTIFEVLQELNTR
jgi:hypothetical protein